MSAFTESVQDFLYLSNFNITEEYRAAPIQRYGVASYYTNSEIAVTSIDELGYLPASSFTTDSKVLILSRLDVNVKDVNTKFKIYCDNGNGLSLYDEFHNPYGSDYEFTTFLPYLEEDWQNTDYILKVEKISGSGFAFCYEPSIIAIELENLVEGVDYFESIDNTSYSIDSNYPSVPDLAITLPTNDISSKYLGIFWSTWDISNPNNGLKIASKVKANNGTIAENVFIRPVESLINRKVLSGLFVLEKDVPAIQLFHRSETKDTLVQQGLILLKFSSFAKDVDAVQKISNITLTDLQRPNVNVTHVATNYGNILVFEDLGIISSDPTDLTNSVSDFLTQDGELIIGRLVSNLISLDSLSDIPAKSRSPKFRFLEDCYRLPISFASFSDAGGTGTSSLIRTDAHILSVSQQIRTTYAPVLNLSSSNIENVKFTVNSSETLTLSSSVIVDRGQRVVINSIDPLNLSSATSLTCKRGVTSSEVLRLSESIVSSKRDFFGLLSDYVYQDANQTLESDFKVINELFPLNTLNKESFVLYGIPKIFSFSAEDKMETGFSENWNQSKNTNFVVSGNAAMSMNNLINWVPPGYISQIFKGGLSGSNINNQYILGIPRDSLGIQGIDYFYDSNYSLRTLNTQYEDSDKFGSIDFNMISNGDPEYYLMLGYVTLRWDTDKAPARVSIYRDYFETPFSGAEVVIGGGNDIDGEIYNTVTVPVWYMMYTTEPASEPISLRAISNSLSSIEHIRSEFLIIRLAQFENWGTTYDGVGNKPMPGSPAIYSGSYEMDSAGNYIAGFAFYYKKSIPEGSLGINFSINSEEILVIPESPANYGGMNSIRVGDNQQIGEEEIIPMIFFFKGYNPNSTFNGNIPTIDLNLKIDGTLSFSDDDIFQSVLFFFSERKILNTVSLDISEILALSSDISLNTSFNPSVNEVLNLIDGTTVTVKFNTSNEEQLNLVDVSSEVSNVITFVDYLTLYDGTTYFERIHPEVTIEEGLTLSEIFTNFKSDGFLDVLAISELTGINVHFVVDSVDSLLLDEASIYYSNPQYFIENLYLTDLNNTQFIPLNQSNNFDVLIKVK